MGVEVVGIENAEVVPVENGIHKVNSSLLLEKENGMLEEEASEPIKFGSNGDEPVKGDGDNVSDTTLSKDEDAKWSEPKQIRSFYLVRYWTYDDPKIQAGIDEADKEIYNRNEVRIELADALRANQSDREQLNSQLQTLYTADKQLRDVIAGKRKEMVPLQHALGKQRNSKSPARGGICSSEEELNNLIRSLHYRIEHESIPLFEEKQLLKEIRMLEGTREKVITNSAVRTKIQNSMGKKDAIQYQVKLIGGDVDGVRKEQQSIRAKVKCLENDRKAIDDDTKSLLDQMRVVTEKRDEAFQTILKLRKDRDVGNTDYYHSRMLFIKAKRLAAKKDIKGLEEFTHTEVEKFMSRWCNSKDFRDDYEKRLLSSLDSRQLSRDGRIRNPDEKPLVEVDREMPSKSYVDERKEDFKSANLQITLPARKVQKQAKNNRLEDLGTTLKHEMAPEEINASEKIHKDFPPVDEEKLKEMKREEEILKAKLAMERKKKLAEKAAAKAAIRAQKEAEKKIKERERKAKRASSATSTIHEEQVEILEESTESESLNGDVSVSVPAKKKFQKEKTFRYKSRSKGSESLPKVILKRKKTTNNWLWFFASILALVSMFLALGYHYRI